MSRLLSYADLHGGVALPTQPLASASGPWSETAAGRGFICPVSLGNCGAVGAYLLSVFVGRDPGPPPSVESKDDGHSRAATTKEPWTVEHIKGSPFRVTVRPGPPFAPHCRCYGEGLSRAWAPRRRPRQPRLAATDECSTSSFTIELRDKYDQISDCAGPQKEFEHKLSAKFVYNVEGLTKNELALTSMGRDLERGDQVHDGVIVAVHITPLNALLATGFASAAYSPPWPGRGLLHVQLSGEHVQGSPFQVRVEAHQDDAAEVDEEARGSSRPVCSAARSTLHGDGLAGAVFTGPTLKRPVVVILRDSNGRPWAPENDDAGSPVSVEAKLQRWAPTNVEPNGGDWVSADEVVGKRQRDGRWLLSYEVRAAGTYRLEVRLCEKKLGDDEDTAVGGTPITLKFPATSDPIVKLSAKAAQQAQRAPTADAATVAASSEVMRASPIVQPEKLTLAAQGENRARIIEALRREETTRRRAEQALRATQAAERERQESRKAVVKRTGGGFVIKYDTSDARCVLIRPLRERRARFMLVVLTRTLALLPALSKSCFICDVQCMPQ